MRPKFLPILTVMVSYFRSYYLSVNHFQPGVVKLFLKGMLFSLRPDCSDLFSFYSSHRNSSGD
eukprot:5470288-Pyramimonas_sp.AAC.1